MYFPVPIKSFFLQSSKAPEQEWGEEQRHREIEAQWPLSYLIPSFLIYALPCRSSPMTVEDREEEGKWRETVPWGRQQRIVLCLGDLKVHSTLPIPLPRILPFSFSLPLSQSMRGKNYSAPIHSLVLLFSVIGNASEENDIHHVMKGEYKNIHH